MFFILKISILLIGILIIGNRAWVKRKIPVKGAFWGGLTIILTAVLIFSMIEYAQNKPKIESLKEDKKFQIVDMNGNIIMENANWFDLLFGDFNEPVINTAAKVSEEEQKENNVIIGLATGLLVLYWVALLYLYEKEENVVVEQKDDIEMLSKYNPMLAACISQNRNHLGRDVVAVILNLIEKGRINLRISNKRNGKYDYMITPGTNSKERLDMIEKFIYDWVFEDVEQCLKHGYLEGYMSRNAEGVLEINLAQRLKKFPEEVDTLGKMKEIEFMAKDRLKFLKANEQSVPFMLKLFNNVLVFLTIILAGDHIINNGIGIVISELGMLAIITVVALTVFILPVFYILSLIVLKTFMVFIKGIGDISEEKTGRKLLSKSISIIVAIIIFMALIIVSPLSSYIALDVLLLGVVFLIIQTDDLMLKHHPKILVDYTNLKRIENKIKDYSLMKDRNIEHMKIWNKYYVYSVALGIPIEVNKKSKINFEDIEENLIINIYDLQGIFCVCKSYLETMWDMDFTDIEKGMKDIKNVWSVNDVK